MSFRGNRRGQALLAAGSVVIAIIAIVLVVRGGDEHVYDEPVTSSTLDDFAARGPLADDEDVVEAAADVWRKGDSYRVETKPEGAIELLWAGKVESAAVDGLVTDKDTPDQVQVVVLLSGNQVATFADRQIDSDRPFDAIGLEEMSNYPSPLLPLPGNLILTADSFPESYDAVDEVGAPLTVQADDGLISTTREEIALRLESTTTPRLGPTVKPGIFVGGQVVRFGAGDLDRVWSMLNSSHLAEPVRSGIGAVTHVSQRKLQHPEIKVLRQSKVPDGRSLLVLTAAGSGVNGDFSTRQAVAVDYALGKKEPSRVTSLGRLDGVGSWVGSAWITRDGAAPYLVVAGGNGTKKIQVYVGRQSERIGPPTGILVPDIEKDGKLPAMVVAGFTKDGSVVQTMSTGQAGR